MIKRFDRFALITSMLALAQPLLWIMLFLSFNLRQGEKVEEVLGGLIVGCFFGFILSIISCILIFLHNRNTNASRIAYVAKKKFCNWNNTIPYCFSVLDHCKLL